VRVRGRVRGSVCVCVCVWGGVRTMTVTGKLLRTEMVPPRKRRFENNHRGAIIMACL
jgi:hypothetical protein